jgi:hypothetical protein
LKEMAAATGEAALGMDGRGQSLYCQHEKGARRTSNHYRQRCWKKEDDIDGEPENLPEGERQKGLEEEG